METEFRASFIFEWCDELQNGLPRVHWCVCQWAFEGFLRHVVDSGGTDAEACSRYEVTKSPTNIRLENIFCQVDCEATNQRAVEAYASSGGVDMLRALNCLKSKCNNFLYVI